MKRSQETERPPYATLRYDVLKRLDISAAEYMMLDMVYHLSAKHGYCYKSTYAIARDLNLTFNAIKKMITRLIDRELLARTDDGLVCASAYIEVAYLTDSAQSSPISAQSAVVHKVQRAQSATNSALSSANSALSSDKNNNRVTENNSILVDSNKSNTTGKSYRVIFYELLQALGFTDKVKPTPGRLTKLATRLRRNGYDDLLAAAKNIGADGYLQGDNQAGKRYGDIDYLLRNDEIVDKWSATDAAANGGNPFDMSKEILI